MPVRKCKKQLRFIKSENEFKTIIHAQQLYNKSLYKTENRNKEVSALLLNWILRFYSQMEELPKIKKKIIL